MFIASKITTINKTSGSILRCLIIIVLITGIQSLVKLQAQSYCSPVHPHGGGFYTSIHKVISVENGFRVTLRVMHDGCSDPDCKPLNQYSVQAEAGSYSDVFYEEIAGDVSLNGINLGPQIAGWSYTGFRISSINGDSRIKSTV